MTSSASHPCDRLVPVAGPFAVRPLARVEEVVAELTPDSRSWGFYTTPAEARLLRAPVERWAEVAGLPHLQELRLFGPEGDFHWREGSGVAITPAPGGAPGSPGWWQRDRRSRLWGERLEGTESWYEERIPDPLFYEGLLPGAEERYAFLLYREYVYAGAVRYVRYLGVEGGAK